MPFGRYKHTILVLLAMCGDGDQRYAKQIIGTSNRRLLSYNFNVGYTISTLRYQICYMKTGKNVNHRFD